MASMSSEMLRKFNSLSFDSKKIVLDQINYLNKEEKNTFRRKGLIPSTLFKWMQNSKKDFEMTDEQIDEFISAVRKEKHAIGD